MILRSGTIKRIHVNQAIIRADRKNQTRSQAITVQTSKGSVPGFAAKIFGTSELVYRPDQPLHCGARLWIETKAAVEVK